MVSHGFLNLFKSRPLFTFPSKNAFFRPISLYSFKSFHGATRLTSSLSRALDSQRLHCQRHILRQCSLITLPSDRPTSLASLYKRKLPQSGVPFSSPSGKRLFEEALCSGYMETFFPLAEQFRTQDEPAYCGLTTLTMILNALQVDPYRTWRGVWRWYHETMLDCCVPLSDIQSKGITFSQFICLAECHGCAFDVISQFDSESFSDHAAADPNFLCQVHQFRDHVRSVTSDPAGERFLVVSYERKALGQTSSGHFSPIGGYHPKKDLVLILDVARFKYPPHWVSVTDLVRAMRTVDASSGTSRGYAVLRKASRPDYGHLTLFQIAIPPKPQGAALLSRFFAVFKDECYKDAFISALNEDQLSVPPLEMASRFFRCFLYALTRSEPMWTLCSTARRLDPRSPSKDAESLSGSLAAFQPDAAVAPHHNVAEILKELEGMAWFPLFVEIVEAHVKDGLFHGLVIDGFDFHGSHHNTGPTTSHCVSVHHLFIVLYLAIIPLERSLLPKYGWDALREALGSLLPTQEDRITHCCTPSRSANDFESPTTLSSIVCRLRELVLKMECFSCLHLTPTQTNTHADT